MVMSVIHNTKGSELRMSEPVQQVFDRLHKFMFDSVYSNDYAKHEEKKVPEFIGLLYTYFVKHCDLLPRELMSVAENEGVERAVCDYISGMTDHYATEKFRELFIPGAWKLS